MVEWLEDDDNGPWLMVLDSADDLGILSAKSKSADINDVRPISSYLPHAAHGTILITTRDDRVSHELGCDEPIVVQPMSPHRAYSLLHSHLAASDKESQKDLEALCKTLDYIPLAITQAAAFIKQYKTTIVEYIKMFSDNESEIRDLLSDNLGDDRRDWQSQNSVFGTLKLSFDLILAQNKRAMLTLSIMGYLDRQGITEELLILPNDRTIDIERAIGILRAFSLISVRSDNSRYDWHRLVQLAARAWVETLPLQGRERPQFRALRAVGSMFSKFKAENSRRCESLIPHALVVNSFCVRDVILATSSLILSVRIAKYFSIHGAFKAALDHGLAGLAVSKDCFGLQDSARVGAICLMASIYRQSKKYQEAEQHYKRAIEIEQKERGPENEVALEIIVDLSTMYRETGKIKRAGQMQNETLKVTERLLGRQHPKTLVIMSELACTYRLLGRMAQSNKLSSMAMNLSEQHCGLEDREELGLNMVMGLASSWHDDTVPDSLKEPSALFGGTIGSYLQNIFSQRDDQIPEAIAMFDAVAKYIPRYWGSDCSRSLRFHEALEDLREIQRMRERLYQDNPSSFFVDA